MSGSQTRYEKLHSLLKDKIVSGTFAPGDRFYSQNELIEKYNLSFSTVSKALDGLVQQGYLIRKQGKGTFIRSLKGMSPTTPGKVQNVYIFAPWEHKPSEPVSTSRLFKEL